MTTIQYKISEEVFKLFPDYCRGVLFIKKVKNRNSPAGLIDMIREEENIIREKYSIETLTGDERINSWRNAYRKAGIKPADFRPSVEAMLRRVLKEQSIPAINALVDIGNLFSLKHFIPIGCHSLHDIENEISLRPAEGTETFIPFGQNVPDNPAKGEIIFTDGNNVMTRRWTWRQSNHSITTIDSDYVEFNIDGLYRVTEEIIENIGNEMIELIDNFLEQPKHTFEIITIDKPSITLEY
jgi:DNA/RNA-binding domain of Phe-tRNA-synthetase-like protein